MIEDGNFYCVGFKNNDPGSISIWVQSKIDLLLKADKRAMIKVTEYSPQRSLSANALYWVWMSKMAGHLTEKGIKVDGKVGVTAEDAHDLMKTQFLGTITKTVSKTKITSLKSTRTLDKTQFCFYMDQIYKWSVDTLSLSLPLPAHTEYSEYREAN